MVQTTVGHVLVTGGPGFIGRRVVQRFVNANWRVSSLSLPGDVTLPQWQGRVEMRFGDLTQPEVVQQIPEGVDTIVHLAAVVGLAGEYERQWKVIAQGTEHICLAAAQRRARLVVVSSIAVYGNKIQSQLCRETDGFGAWQGAYGWAKQGQERIALEFAARHDLALTLVRPANVYGLGGGSAWGDRYLEFIRSTGGAVLGDGERNDAGLVYVENLADALWLTATDRRAVGRTFNVCDEQGVSWRRFNDDMAALIGMPPPPGVPIEGLLALARANEDPAAFVPPRDQKLPFLEALNLVGFDNRIDASAIRRELGWMPRLPYDEALSQMRSALPPTDRRP